MTRDEAAEIQRHLLDAAAAMSRAEHAIADAGYDARKAMGRYLGEVGASLHFGLLHTIYQQFPDLRPPPNELPTIDSELCWDEVTLPASVSERDLDKMIFVLLKPHWRKTAMILVLAHEHCAQQGWPIEPEVVAAWRTTTSSITRATCGCGASARCG